MAAWNIKVGGSSQFVEHMLWVHPHAQYDQRSKEWGPSKVNIMNQWHETTELLCYHAIAYKMILVVWLDT